MSSPASPDLALARLVLTALALAALPLATVAILSTIASSPATSEVSAVRCLSKPVDLLATGLHSAPLIGSLAVVALGLAGGHAATRQRLALHELRRATQGARLPAMPPTVVAAAQAAGVAGRIDLVTTSRAFGFVYGWRRPRICLSTGLVDRLNADELQAVLHHEAWHLRRRDPLRLLVVRSITAAFRFAPPVRRLGQQVVLASEIAADRHAIGMMGHPQALAGALLKVADDPMALPAFAGHLDARVAALAGDPPPLPRVRAGRFALAALVAEGTLLASILGQNGPFSLVVLWFHPVC